MEKAIVIIGPRDSGKSSLANKIAGTMTSGNVEYISAQNVGLVEDPFKYGCCTKETKLVIVDEVKKVEFLNYFLNDIVNPITVNRPQINSFKIKVSFIFVMAAGISLQDLALGASWDARFQVIEMHPKNSLIPIES